jgi:hypothetical protein
MNNKVEFNPDGDKDLCLAIKRERIREIFLAYGFKIEEGAEDLAEFIYTATEAAMRENAIAVRQRELDAQKYRNDPNFRWASEYGTPPEGERMRITADGFTLLVEDGKYWIFTPPPLTPNDLKNITTIRTGGTE